MLGIILLDKKAGITSFEALKDIKRELKTGKVGHTGTLDKFASGLLIVLTGKALKLSSWFSACDKQYIGKIHFGRETDTLDPEGAIVAEAPLPSREDVEKVIPLFTGEILQSPPAYSAIHVNGKRASALARSGQAPEMKKRPVVIYKLELHSWEPPFAEIFVHCSSGTYIRSLARDIALAAGSRGYLCELARTQVAGFSLGTRGVVSNLGVELHAEITNKKPGPYSPVPITKNIIAALGLPWFEVESSDAEKIKHGKPLDLILTSVSPCLRARSSVALFSGEELIAIVEKTGEKWKYGCVLASPVLPQKKT